MRFAILIPSAEGKQPGGNPLAPDVFDYRTSDTFNYFNVLNPERRKLIDALQYQLRNSKNAEKLFALKDENLQEAIDVNLEVYDSPLMAAIERYSKGVLYQAMDFEGLPTGAQRRLLENGIIFSGMFGLLRPDDLIPNYRLKMDVTVEEVGKVSKYWRPIISDILNKLLTGKVVWNLLPSSFEEAWEDAQTYDIMYRLKFFKEEKGELQPVTHGVKELRGHLIHFIATSLADDPEALIEWDSPEGYEPDMEASELGEQGGTIMMVSRPGWQKRRKARKAAKEAEEAERRARREEAAAEEESDDSDDQED
ncbi:MAG: peroxide stress protein YaaA [Rubricoccaceae bacterium]|nr:peroxide stress protein YaaA [Rubricoccaceae bacterium]